jgi:hypothetical protein
MRLPWQAREYERTCADCGYSWRVPRAFARHRISISGFNLGTDNTGRGMAAGRRRAP